MKRKKKLTPIQTMMKFVEICKKNPSSDYPGAYQVPNNIAKMLYKDEDNLEKLRTNLIKLTKQLEKQGMEVVRYNNDSNRRMVVRFNIKNQVAKPDNDKDFFDKLQEFSTEENSDDE